MNRNTAWAFYERWYASYKRIDKRCAGKPNHSFLQSDITFFQYGLASIGGWIEQCTHPDFAPSPRRILFLRIIYCCGEILHYSFLPYGDAQRIALPALGRGRRSRPARKMTRRRKLPEICAESPASGARFVRRFFIVLDLLTEKDTTAHKPNFYTQL